MLSLLGPSVFPPLFYPKLFKSLSFSFSPICRDIVGIVWVFPLSFFLFLFLLFTLALPMFAPASRFTCRLGSSLRLVVGVEAAAVSFSSDQSARASSPVRVFPCIYFPYRFYVFAINQQQQQCFSKSQLLSMHCKLCVCCWVNAQHLLYLLCLCIRCVCVWTA